MIRRLQQQIQVMTFVKIDKKEAPDELVQNLTMLIRVLIHSLLLLNRILEAGLSVSLYLNLWARSFAELLGAVLFNHWGGVRLGVLIFRSVWYGPF